MRHKLYDDKHQTVVMMDDLTNRTRCYKQAYKNKTLLVGPTNDKGVDYTHFNHMLSVVKFKTCNTMMDATRELWRNFYPYLKNLLEAYIETRSMLHQEWEEQDKMLVKYAAVMTENKLMSEFIKQEDLTPEYDRFKTKFNKVIGE